LTVLRYVELDPLWADRVRDLARHPWSSYIVHGLGQSDGLINLAPLWAALRMTEAGRQA